MANLKQHQSTDQQVLEAVNAIKTAILQGQYEAAKDVNRVQLALYYAVGRFLSLNTRQGVWGTGIIESISERLRKELPGLRGFSSTSLKKMRLFYEFWELLDNKSSVATDEIDKTCSSVLSDKQVHVVDLSQSFQIPNVVDFPIDDFFKVPFSHHIEIISKGLDLKARYYYIQRVANEHLSVESLRRLINESAHKHQALIPNNFSQTIPNAKTARKAVMMFKDEYLLNFINVEEIGERESIDVDERVVEFVELVIRDYSKPMGVATYTSHQDVPEPFRKALPNIEELKKLL